MITYQEDIHKHTNGTNNIENFEHMQVIMIRNGITNKNQKQTKKTKCKFVPTFEHSFTFI